MKRTVVAFLLAPLWVPAAEIAYAAYKMPFLKPGHLVIQAILWAIFAYGGALIFGLPAFHALGFFGVRNRKSFWFAIVLGFGTGVLTTFCFLVLVIWLFAPKFNIAFVPPLQAPESYNLSQVLEEVKAANAQHPAD
jgi:hypothetical protein